MTARSARSVISYSAFVAGLKRPDVCEARAADSIDDLAIQLKSLPDGAAWSGASIDPLYRVDKNVKCMNVLVYDIDGKRKDSGRIDTAHEAFAGFEHMIHATKSHKPERHSFRVIVPLKTPLVPRAYRRAWRSGADRLAEKGVYVDAATKDLSRAWLPPTLKCDVTVVQGERFEPSLERTGASALEREIGRVASATEGTRNATLFDAAKRMRPLIMRGDVIREDVVEQLSAAARRAGLPDEQIGGTISRALAPRDRGKVEIIMSDDFDAVVDRASEALANVASHYVLAGNVVEIFENQGVVRARVVHAGMLKYLLAQVCAFVRVNAHGVQGAWPPDAVAATLLARPDKLPVPRLKMIADAPTVDASGRLLLQHGYDATAQVFVCAAKLKLELGDDDSQSDARAAYATLVDLLVDFPFACRAHAEAVFVAALLTIVCRLIFDGPAPATAVSATARGAGKTLLIEVIGTIACGSPLTMMSLPASDTEISKCIGAFLRDGTNILAFDNIRGTVDSEALDMLLTATRARVRCLGVNEMIEGSNAFAIFLTGNGLSMGGDMHRRVLPITIEAPEKPETRTKWRYPQLLQHVETNRGRYVACLLRIMRAWIRAGRPTDGVRPLGKFERWSHTIAAAVTFASGVNPIDARVDNPVVADRSGELLGMLMKFIEDRCGNRAITVTHLMKLSREPSPDGELLEAIFEEVVGPQRSAKRFGRFLASAERRVVGGRRLVSDGKGHGGLRKWRVERAANDGVSS